jgi:hypothetical protein
MSEDVPLWLGQLDAHVVAAAVNIHSHSQKCAHLGRIPEKNS